jgi:hypothetical protein
MIIVTHYHLHLYMRRNITFITLRSTFSQLVRYSPYCLVKYKTKRFFYVNIKVKVKTYYPFPYRNRLTFFLGAESAQFRSKDCPTIAGPGQPTI